MGTPEDGSEHQPGIDLSQWVREIVAIDPGAPALHFSGTWRTWGMVGSGIDALQGAIGSDGPDEGGLIGVVIRNRPEIVRAIVGVFGTHRCLVTLSSAVPVPALADEIRRTALPVVIASPSDWGPELTEAAREVGALGLAFADDDGPAHVVVPRGPRPPDAPTSRPGVAVQMLTSGTTGTPKRIDLLYRSIEHEIVSTTHYSASAQLAAPRLGSGVSIVWNPLLHIGGLRGLITSLVAGRRIAMLERFSVPAWAELVKEHRPRAISLVPSAMRMVLDADLPRDVFDGVQALISGTAPLAPETAEEFEAKYGVPVLVVYGATEFAGGVAGWTIKDWREFGGTKRGSVGRANPGISVRIVDPDTGQERPIGETGLLEVSGLQLAQEGWVRTTDLARLDADGFMWIEGRSDDVIIRGGFKVATGAVTDILRRHPAVLDACVIGVPDSRLGEVPVAAVELRGGATLTGDELREWAHQEMSGYQVPVAVLVVEGLPRTPSMKVSQPAVRALFPPRE